MEVDVNQTPFRTTVAFFLGPVPVTATVLVTSALVAALALAAWLISRRLDLRNPGRVQAVAELIVDTIRTQIHDILRLDAAPFLPLIGTLFLFILVANWSSLIPGVEPPTAHIETDAALALIVLVATIWFGIRQRGAIGYLRTFAQPTILMLPLNLVGTITRTFALMVRLFGNVMGGLFVIGIVLSLAGLLVPIPLMALDLLVGSVQAYIFAVLAAVFIGSAVSGGEGT
jgi:F-type H+-transporting ATPase subunit a